MELYDTHTDNINSRNIEFHNRTEQIQYFEHVGILSHPLPHNVLAFSIANPTHNISNFIIAH